jgi:peptidoglycan lytic transglycosylase
MTFADGRMSGAAVAVRRRGSRQELQAKGLRILVLCCFVGGCSSSERLSTVDRKYGVSASPRVISEQSSYQRASLPKGGGSYKVGKPYQIAGRWYHPREEPNYAETGIASWYGADFHGRKTANGEIYDMNALTAAHRTLPLPSYAYVTALKTGRTVLVRINDRGPFAGNRIIDLSKATATALGLKTDGLGKVRVRYAGRAPLNGDDRHERRFLAAQRGPVARDYATAQSFPARRRPSRRVSRPPMAVGGRAYSSRQPTASTRGWSLTGYRQSLGRR